MEEAAAAAAATVGVVGGGVRVVARICPPPDPAAPASTTAPAANTFRVSATRGGGDPRSSDAPALLAFTTAAAAPSSSSQGRAPSTRKDEHKLDWCYHQDETNHHVFLNEVKPLIRHLTVTSGTNACVIACGSGNAKDHLFVGSQDQPGLVTMAMEQILDFSKTISGAVRVSSYQVVQDTQIFDLLEPKNQEVLVLEDAQGRTHLKGLSVLHVKSMEDFAQLSCFDSNTQNKQSTKASTQLQTRGHQGLIVHISSFDQGGTECAIAKMNFLNLTDYVDPKQKNNGGAAALSKSNKSMYALMNVVRALNSNQNFVPYRQSKVTHILQDSLCKTSGAVLIACLDEISCQDTVSTLSLAARSSRVANEQYRRSMSVTSCKKANVNLCANAKSSSRPFLTSIHQPSHAVEKHDRPQWNNSTTKASRTPIANKRSQPIMHSAKKTESLLSTPIKLKQKDALPTMSGRSQPMVRSAKKAESSLSTSIKVKQKDAKSTLSRSMVLCLSTNLSKVNKSAEGTKQKDAKSTLSRSMVLCPSTNSSKEDMIVVAPAAVKVEEVQSSRDVEIHAPSTDVGFDKPSDTLDTVSSETQKMEEEDNSSSVLHTSSSCTDLSETCSSSIPDVLVKETPVNTKRRSPKLTDRLREISNSLKLLSTRPISITTQKVGMEMPQKVGMETPQKMGMQYVQPMNIDVPEPKTPAMHLKFEQAEDPSNSFKARSTGIKVKDEPMNIDVPEPKTPAMHLKFEQVEDPSNSFKARSTGIKKALAQECLTFLNSANKEELKSLRGIGEKRANYIIELRENSPEPFKEVDHLRSILGMDQREIKKMMSGIIDS